MKKLAFLLAPLMCFSTLVGCNTKEEPEPVPTNFYHVSFDLNGGVGSIPTQEVEEGKTATIPPSPIREHGTSCKYEFKEWQLDGIKYDFKSVIYKDIELVASWTPVEFSKFTVHFDLMGGNVDPDKPDQYENQRVTEFQHAANPGSPTKNPDQTEGLKYQFKNWCEKGKTEAFDFENTEIIHDITLQATYYETLLDEYTVSFKLNEGKAVPALPDMPVKEFSKITKPTSVITKDSSVSQDFEFDYWSTSNDVDAEEYNFDTPITDNLTLYAHYKATTRKYDVTFMIGIEGQRSKLYSTPVDYDSFVDEPSYIPDDVFTQEFTYTFNTWVDKDGIEFKFTETPIQGETTIYASYTNTRNKYDINVTVGGDYHEGCSVTGANTYEYGETVTLTASAPGNRGLVGWYDEEGTLLSESNTYQFTCTDNKNITAKFDKAVTIEVKNYLYKTYIFGEGKYLLGKEIELFAVPQELTPLPRDFAWLASDKTLYSRDNPLYITAEENMNTYFYADTSPL